MIPDGFIGVSLASARRDFTINAMMADPFTGQPLSKRSALLRFREALKAAFFADPDTARLLREHAPMELLRVDQPESVDVLAAAIPSLASRLAAVPLV